MFLEYFAAAYVAATCDSPADVARLIAPKVARQEWDVVADLAAQIKDQTTDRGAERIMAALLADRRHRSVVRDGRAHAALVFADDGTAQGWCQYGSPGELPNIKHRRAYDKDAPPRPDWRITCFFVDRKHRGQGIARAALEGALDQIAHAGGGRVEAISEVTSGRQAQGRFLFSATVELFEQYGFSRGRQVGKHAWIVSRQVPAA